MYELKRLHTDAVPAALAKAERYRLLNEPQEAESICRDILAVDSGNVDAKTTLVLALTDQFDESLATAWPEALAIVESLADGYGRAYYRGILHERRAKSHLKASGRRSPRAVRSDLRFAMESFAEASSSAPPGDDSAILRWNTCARLMNAEEAPPTARPDHPSSTFLE